MPNLNNIDHNLLNDLGFHYQGTPHAERYVYSRKNGICRGDVFLEQCNDGYEARVASYYENKEESEFLRILHTAEDLYSFFLYGLQIRIM